MRKHFCKNYLLAVAGFIDIVDIFKKGAVASDCIKEHTVFDMHFTEKEDQYPSDQVDDKTLQPSD